MITPAIAGPISRAPLTIDELIAMALPRSFLSSTIWMRNDCRAGISNALMSPWNTASAITSPSVMTCASVSAAIASDCAAAAACVHTRRLRRFSRSTQTPATGPNRNATIWPEKLTTPSNSAECVNRYTSQLVASRVIQVPISEMV